MSKILAINHGIGSSVGYFENGKAVFCIEEERLNRVKNWMGFPYLATQYIFDNNIANKDELTNVVLCNTNAELASREEFYKEYDSSFERGVMMNSSSFNVLKEGIKNSEFYKQSEYYVNRILDGNRYKDIAKNTLINKYRIDEKKITRLDHHTCHAASVYYGLAKNIEDPYLIFTLDGGGDGIKASIFKASGGKMDSVQRSNHYSIGSIYSAVTYFLGFTPHEHEYKLMGLAPYVNPSYTEKYKKYFSKFLSLKNEDTEFYNPMKLDHASFFKIILNDLRKDRFDNVAAGLQAFCEEIVLRWIKGNVKKYNIKNVLGSGGVFMNVKMNMLISKLPEIDYFDVFPSCGDESNIFGAAYFVHNQNYKREVNLLSEYTVGTNAADDLEEALELYKDQINFSKKENINQYIAEQLINNKIIGRCSGKMEFGARALGNRSIMANPGNLQNVTLINQAVKKRDFWMPFAPAMPSDEMHKLVYIPKSLNIQKSPYMMMAFEVREGMDAKIICGIHQADSTARVEALDKERYPDFYEIVSYFNQSSGTPCVLNTSFNLHGFPIVENSKQAIEVLLQSKIDELVIDNIVISRRA